MELIRASLRVNIAIEEYNEICKTGDWVKIKMASDKVRTAKREYDCIKRGFRK